MCVTLSEMCSGSEAGSYLRFIDFVYHATLGVRVIQKEKTNLPAAAASVEPRTPVLAAHPISAFPRGGRSDREGWWLRMWMPEVDVPGLGYNSFRGLRVVRLGFRVQGLRGHSTTATTEL